MSQHSWFRRNWKLLLNIVTFIALAAFVVAIHKQLVQTFHDLFRVNAWALLLLLPVEFLNYDAQARMYRDLFAIVGNKMSYKYMLQASIELNFINNLFPSGGAAGISYFGLRMRDGEVTGTKATVVHLLKLAMLVLSFEILIVLGVFCLAVQGKMSSLILLVAAVLSTMMIVLTAVAAFIIGSKRRIAGFFAWSSVQLNKLLRLVRRGPNRHETINVEGVRQVFEELHENYVLIRSKPGALRGPFFWGLMANFWELMAVYVVYIAFGHLVNLGAVILAYAVANVAGVVSVLPGGVGIYEGLMTIVLTATGVPSRLSLPVTVMYRVLNTAVQFPPGYYFYRKAIKGAGKRDAVSN